jgi:hypothetical protein
VLTATIKLLVEIPTPTDPDAPPHKFTLTNEDGSYSKTLTFPADAQPSDDTQGMSILTFEDVTDGHTYTLQGDGGDAPYTLFDTTKYHEIVDKFGGQGGGAAASSPPASQPPPSGAGGSNQASST